ncbi:CapA family protein [Chryseobacterium indoltheticum]|uniref:CapA family protein n=1 Tax=Chryseobacterium indoltheticum TaxID=254 RepID=UPI001913230C|nr:CapA family protein [Chryseobacterium indoltheticum]QQQ28054.1 CapA family protein [Chryseobacterium indoltheticum]
MSSLKILIAGDFCPIGRNEDIIDRGDYKSLFNGFEEITKSMDYSIVNLECPITKSKKKIKKTGPCIKSENMKSLEALKFANFNLLTLANNHIQDYSEEGVIDTIEHAKKYQFDIIGAGKNKKAAAQPLIKKINNVNIGFINIAENEFCAASDNCAGANTFDLIDNLKTIKELRPKVDKIILIYHGGREHYQLPTPNQRKRLRFFIENGVDAIVAHHTHCFSGYEFYNQKPIIYSLGNFIFDYKKKYQKGKWTEGMSAILKLRNINDNFEIDLITHRQGTIYDSSLRILKSEEEKKITDKVEELSKLITNDKEYFIAWYTYLRSQEKFYLSSLYIKNIFLRALFIKGILPIKLLINNHNKLLLNLNRCETHREILNNILSNNERKNI